MLNGIDSVTSTSNQNFNSSLSGGYRTNNNNMVNLGGSNSSNFKSSNSGSTGLSYLEARKRADELLRANK